MSGRATAAAAGEVVLESSEAFLSSLSGGFIVAAVAAALALVKGIVQSVTEAKVRQTDAVAWATRLNIPNAADYPRFVVDVQAMGPSQRMAVRNAAVSDYAKAKTTDGKRAAVFKVATVDQIMVLDLLRLRGEIPPAAPQSVLVKTYARQNPWTWLVGGGMLAAAAVVYATRES